MSFSSISFLNKQSATTKAATRKHISKAEKMSRSVRGALDDAEGRRVPIMNRRDRSNRKQHGKKKTRKSLNRSSASKELPPTSRLHVPQYDLFFIDRGQQESDRNHDLSLQQFEDQIHELADAEETEEALALAKRLADEIARTHGTNGESFQRVVEFLVFTANALFKKEAKLGNPQWDLMLEHLYDAETMIRRIPTQTQATAPRIKLLNLFVTTWNNLSVALRRRGDIQASFHYAELSSELVAFMHLQGLQVNVSNHICANLVMCTVLSLRGDHLKAFAHAKAAVDVAKANEGSQAESLAIGLFNMGVESEHLERGESIERGLTALSNKARRHSSYTYYSWAVQVVDRVDSIDSAISTQIREASKSSQQVVGQQIRHSKSTTVARAGRSSSAQRQRPESARHHRDKGASVIRSGERRRLREEEIGSKNATPSRRPHSVRARASSANIGCKKDEQAMDAFMQLLDENSIHAFSELVSEDSGEEEVSYTAFKFKTYEIYGDKLNTEQMRRILFELDPDAKGSVSLSLLRQMRAHNKPNFQSTNANNFVNEDQAMAKFASLIRTGLYQGKRAALDAFLSIDNDADGRVDFAQFSLALKAIGVHLLKRELVCVFNHLSRTLDGGVPSKLVQYSAMITYYSKTKTEKSTARTTKNLSPHPRTRPQSARPARSNVGKKINAAQGSWMVDQAWWAFQQNAPGNQESHAISNTSERLESLLAFDEYAHVPPALVLNPNEYVYLEYSDMHSNKNEHVANEGKHEVNPEGHVEGVNANVKINLDEHVNGNVEGYLEGSVDENVYQNEDEDWALTCVPKTLPGWRVHTHDTCVRRRLSAGHIECSIRSQLRSWPDLIPLNQCQKKKKNVVKSEL